MYRKTIQRLEVFYNAGPRGLTIKGAGITIRSIKWLVKKGYIFAGVNKPQRYYHIDFEQRICQKHPKIKQKRESVLLARRVHRLGKTMYPDSDIVHNELYTVSRSGSSQNLLSVHKQPQLVPTGYQTSQIRYLTAPIDSIKTEFATAHELHHHLLQDPIIAFGALGTAIGYSHPGFYEFIARFASYPVLALHHLQFSFPGVNPLRLESFNRFEIDDIPITVRRHKSGTISIWTSSTDHSFKNSFEILAFMNRISEVLGYGPPPETWRINQMDVAKDPPIDDQPWRFEPIPYTQFSYNHYDLAIYRHLTALRYEVRMQPKCTIGELDKFITRGLNVMALAANLPPA
jgi:hypothetical protein